MFDFGFCGSWSILVLFDLIGIWNILYYFFFLALDYFLFIVFRKRFYEEWLLKSGKNWTRKTNVIY